VDIRVLAATTANLEAAVRAGTFRRDLLLRLGAVTLELPALRARGSDVILIAERLLQNLAALYQIPVPELRAEARQALVEYSWPGNIRELKQALERALLLSPVGSLALGELAPPQREVAGWTPSIPFPAELDQITSAAARATLEACGGNVSQAARQLAVSRGRLRRLIRLSPEPGTIRRESSAEELSPPS
jgi:DNA-binding NtrC family response regulator